MKIVPLLDIEAINNPISFLQEAKNLNLDFGFKHISINETKKYKHIFITDRAALQYTDYLINKKLYLWILEPQVINPIIYNFAIDNFYKFVKVFTHHKHIADIINKKARKKICFWYPWGSYYIPTIEHKIYNKNKNVSIVCSSKTTTVGHKLRHECFRATKHLLDGFKCGEPPEAKLKWHADYRYSIAVENCQVDGYFTEKILDCFRTGTIPIYNGDPEILNYFNADGIILFDNTNELLSIISNLTEDLYNKKLTAVEENFNIAEKYLYPWKFIIENYIL